MVLLAMQESFGQDKNINLQKQVNIRESRQPLETVLQQITQQTGVRFSVNTRKFPLSKPISIKKLRQTVAGLLAEIRGTTGMDYTFVGGHIIFVDAVLPKPTASFPPKKKKEPGQLIVNKKPIQEPAPGDTIREKYMKGESPVIAVYIPNDTGSKLPKTFAPDLLRQKLTKLRTNVRTQASRAAYLSATAGSSGRTRMRGTSDWVIRPGVVADDLRFIHGSLHAGHQILYGIVSLSTDFKNSGVRYGAGLSIRLGERWRLHAQFTTGQLNTPFDSAHIVRGIKTSLNKAALLADLRINERWSFQFGPVFNRMRSTHVMDGVEQRFNIKLSDIQDQYGLPKPWYTLSNNFDINRTSFSSTWIGFQAGLFYNIYLFNRR